MIHLFELFFFLLIIFHFIRTTFYEVFLWQLKEYRFDRFCSLLSTSQGKKYFFNPIGILKLLILFFLLSRFHLNKGETLTYILFVVVFILYFFEFIAVLIKKKNILKFPKFTIKALLICILSIFFLVSSFIILRLNKILLLLILDRTLSFFVAFAVLLVNFPFAIIKKILSLRALQKIVYLNNLTVIGITGSYGKTSTKEFLYQLFSSKYKVSKTKRSQNTEIAVAQTVLKEIKKNDDFFIAEIGAYKKGEISSICRIIKPKIGILTGINEQHVELFGSLEKTMKAKFELIENLKLEGLVVLNWSNEYIKKMYNWIKDKRKDLEIWRCEKVESFNAEKIKQLEKEDNYVFAYSLKVKKDSLSFVVGYKNERVVYDAPVYGIQNIDNILAALCVCLSYRMSLLELKNKVKHLRPPENTMQLIKLNKKTVVIDDTFNVNPIGVFAALDYLKLYKGNKILILTPIIELGEYAEKIHFKIGKKAASVCDLIILTNSNYYDSFIKGATKVKNGSKKVHIINRVNLDKLLKLYLDKNAMVVFEGKEAKKILDKLVKLG